MIEWFGELPTRWETKRIAAILSQRKERNDPVQTNFILSLSAKGGVVPYSERDSSGNKSKDDLKSYSIARKNDLVINCMNVIIGSSGVTKWDGTVSTVYYTLFPKSDDVNINYFEYIFRSKPFYRYLCCFGKGILEIRLRISMENLNNVYLTPPTHRARPNCALPRLEGVACK